LRICEGRGREDPELRLALRIGSILSGCVRLACRTNERQQLPVVGVFHESLAGIVELEKTEVWCLDFCKAPLKKSASSSPWQ
jgi:hypothetical protein